MTTSGQRAFASLKSRVQASEMRSQMSSITTDRLKISHPTAAPQFGVDSCTDTERSPMSYLPIPVYDVVEPVDFEECVAQRRGFDSQTSSTSGSTGNSSSSPRRLHDFPGDDIDVKTVARDRQTLDEPIPIDFDASRIEPKIRDIISSYSADLCIVQRRFSQYTSGSAHEKMCFERPILAETLPRQSYEIDAADIVTSSERESYASTDSTDTAGTDSACGQPFEQPDPLIQGVTARVTLSQIDSVNEQRRSAQRVSAAMSLLPLQPAASVIEHTPFAPFPCEQTAHRFALNLLSFRLETSFEPIFGSLALYDIRAGKKMSETFHFDFNSTQMKCLLRAHVPHQDESTLARSCVFNVTNPSPDMYVIIRLEKVLQAADIGEAVEPYLKDVQTFNHEKQASAASEYCERLGAFRMPFAWTAIEVCKLISPDAAGATESMLPPPPGVTAGGASTATLASLAAQHMNAAQSTPTKSMCSQPPAYVPSDTESIVSADRESAISGTGSFVRVGSSTSTSRSMASSSRQQQQQQQPALDPATIALYLHQFTPVTLAINSFWKMEADKLSDADLMKLLVDHRRSSLLSRRKCIPGCLSVQLSPVQDDLPNRLNPHLLRVQPFLASDGNHMVKELLEFPIKQTYCVNSCYRNLLYIYPKCVNFSSRPGSARNICVKVELVFGNYELEGLPVVYGKSSCPEYQTHAYTSVLYHNKTPVFTDEIKAKLPIDLTDAHHLLFTFYHVSCKLKQDVRDTLTPIGYSWIPLYQDSRLKTGDFELPISLDKLPDSYFYLSPEVALPNCRWLDNHKPVFSVSLRASSTVHTDDAHLDHFFNLYQLARSQKRVVPEHDLLTAIRNLSKARPEPLVQFLYVVLDKLLDMMVNPIASNGALLDVAGVCFETLAQLVKILNLLSEFADANGRCSLLATYIQYHRVSPSTEEQEASMCSSAPAAATASPQSSAQLLDIIKGFEKTDLRAAADALIGSSYTPKLLHEELASQWCVCGSQVREMALHNAWFFFELMLKSMAEHLSVSNRLYLPRRLRFSDSFVDDLQTLVGALTAELCARVGKDWPRVQTVNRSLSLFVRDCLSLMDRTFVMSKLIKVYARLITSKMLAFNDQAGQLMSLKLDFTRVLCSHEHYVVLNLPFLLGQPASATPAASSAATGAAVGGSPSPCLSSRSSVTSMATTIGSSQSSSIGAAELTAEYRSRHFICGLLLSDLASVLDTGNAALQAKAIASIAHLLQAHDHDTRIQESGARGRIAQLYLPLVGIVLDACSQLYDPCAANAGNAAASRTGDAKNAGDIMQAISLVAPAGGRDSSRTLSYNCTRQLLASFCWVLKNMEATALRAWLKDLSANRLTQLLDVLQLCASCFEYSAHAQQRQAQSKNNMFQLPVSVGGQLDSAALSRQHQMLTDVILGCENTQEFLRNRGARASPRNVGSERFRVAPTAVRRADTTEQAETPLVDAATEANLCAEINMTVLDTLEMLLKVVSGTCDDNLLPLINRVLLHQLSCNTSQMVTENVLNTQRALVARCPELFFECELEQCADLCLHLLRHGAGRLQTVRSSAAASLYLLMRQSFECGASLARVKMQITVALSTLVSNSNQLAQRFSEVCLRRTLKTVQMYAEHDIASDAVLRETTFSEQVKDLVFNLHMILSDTVKMKDAHNDFEMLTDLIYRIAKGYQNSPDLRVTWLCNLATKHVERANHVEAAHCYLHAAAVVAEYMYMLEHVPYLPDGAHVFAHKLSDNVMEECAVSDDVLSPHEEGICQSKHFTEQGLVRLLQDVAEHYYRAGQYECMCNTYKLLVPVMEEYRDYKRCAHIHQRCSDALGRIEGCSIEQHVLNGDYLQQPLVTSDKRVFATYFRVGFYGQRFADLDGVEFIYKEPPITKLAEISHRLEAFYGDRYGDGNVEVIKDSNVVNRNRLNPDKAYLQITYVEPYFEAWELRRRRTHLERNINLHQFIFATPFTLDGRAHGELRAQHKRKTVLTTEYALPYIKTRVRVIERQTIVITPIQVAIEDVMKKTRELAAATVQEPPDAKMLQMVLQGCIGTTVNQGPIEVANVFLGDVVDKSMAELTSEQHQLRLAFKDFSTKCSDALRKNKKLIGADQKAYHEELERNYLCFTSKLTPMVSSAGAIAARIRRHHHQRGHETGQPQQPHVQFNVLDGVSHV